MKRILSLILSVALAATAALSLTSCGKKTYVVGICQLVQHPALDAATKGFKDALIEEFGDSITFDEQNASNDSGTCSTIVTSFVSKNVDLIMANATPALQAAYNGTTTIPILGTSITEYGVALELQNFNGTVGNNVSGTSDLAPLDQQGEMILELFPDVQKVGLLFCSAEPNSLYQVTVMEQFLQAHNVTTARYTFSDSNDVAAVTTAAATACDVLYIPTDNTAASCAETIGAIVREKHVPVIAGEEGICSGCGVASLSISYYDLGVTTGKMAVKILKGQAKVSEMPIEYTSAKKVYNAEICEELGITVPSTYTPISK